MSKNKLYGGIEAGGTKFSCIVASGPGDIAGRCVIPTKAPDETLGRVVDFFRKYTIAGAGLACFGPLDLDPASGTYGFITNTPKTLWIQCNILAALRSQLGVDVAIHTDVVGAALAEARWGSGRGARGVLYITIGTGIGGGFVYDLQPAPGVVHAELGHILVRREPDDTFPGICPYHGDCLEGLASGPAIEQRTRSSATTLPAGHPAWDLESRIIATAIVNYIFTLAPDIIIVGGGVAHAPGLISMIRKHVAFRIANYGSFGSLARRIDQYIVQPELGDDAGALGAVALSLFRKST